MTNSQIATSGTTFKGQNALLTGVGKGSIGVEVVKGLLAGGARVVLTTSSYSRATVEYYVRYDRLTAAALSATDHIICSHAPINNSNDCIRLTVRVGPRSLWCHSTREAARMSRT